ncbi:hypothetical protein HOY82DRAFT_541535 [Tuber indicum]|nr:hypothetical protein HOY82DRAFT_541535 [Tuber indicum]
MPVPQQHDVRAPNPYPDRDSQGVESLLQPPPQLRNSNTNTHQESAQPSSLPTLLNHHYQNPDIPTQDSERNPLNLPLAYPVPPAVTAIRSLEPSPQPPRRLFSQAFEDEPSTRLISKRKRPS